MKTAVMLLILLTFFAPNLLAQDYTQWSLPEGAKARFGKGGLTGTMQYSSDGTRLAVASYIGVWLYDTATYQEVALTGPTHEVLSLTFSPNGKTLARGGENGKIHLWDPIKGEQRQTLIGHSSEVRSVAFSPDGETLASGGVEATVRLWDATTGEHKKTITGHMGPVHTVAFSPDGKILASGASDGTVLLWDIPFLQLTKD